jgi:hypothetical protein
MKGEEGGAGANGGRGESFAYLFEAKGIQRYILDSGPLRDLVGASDLVADLAAGSNDDLLDRILDALECKEEVKFSRRAGGAFCVHACDWDTLSRIKALWRLVVGLRCPGLEFSDAGPVQGIGEIEALDAARKAATAMRHNTAAELPPAGHPFTAFNPRTGRLITRLYAYGKKEEPDIVEADVITDAHRRRAEALRGKLDGVAKRFLRGEHIDRKVAYVFPRNLASEKDEDEESRKDNPLFPFVGEDRRIAVIHADLSGLGQIFQSVTKPAPGKDAKSVRGVATAIEAAIELAAQIAVTDVLLQGPALTPWPNANSVLQYIVAARPIVLGGDDITILVRADLALPFARRLLVEIEEQSGQQFERLHREYPGIDMPGPYLSACAGIAVVQAGQPFLMANTLAESLCKFAKAKAKSVTKQNESGKPQPVDMPYPSALAFHVSQSTLQEEYEDAILLREMTALVDGKKVMLTANPYGIGRKAAHIGATLDDLFKLTQALDLTPRGRGKLIEAARFLFDNATAANEAWERWRYVVDNDREGLEPGDRSRLAAIDERLAPFASSAADASNPVKFEHLAGALSDALELIDLRATDWLDAEMDAADGSAATGPAS